MAMLPQEGTASIIKPVSVDYTGEEVVISGISGQFPNSENVMKFMDNLYNKVDMVTKSNSMFKHAELSEYSGKISDIEKFDAQFFRVTYNQADSLDPVGRKLMEHAYGALYDAGVNPVSCKGKKIGVFTSAYNVESGKLIGENIKSNLFIISGTCKTMHANRISYWLDSKGPSFAFDSPAGAILAVQHAVTSIMSGECDAAIVGSGELPLDPIMNINMRKAGISCLDGKTRCFDRNGDGCVLSQAVGVLFLQKAKDAKRIYAEVRGTGVEFGLNNSANFDQKRDQNRIVQFLENVYSDSGLQPQNVEYVEAHGAAHPEADTNELEAIAQVFGKQKSVMVGCVKSNMGDSLPVASICSIIKLCLAYHKGELAGNLHFDDPLDTPAIKEGKVKVLTNNKCFNRGFTAVNSFSFTGTDSHLILKGHNKLKNLNNYKIGIPRLVLVAGRYEKAVKKIFDNLNNQPLDPEYIGMLNDLYQVETPGFTCRGYIILESSLDKTISLSQSTHINQEVAPPLWLLYSGMGSQWAGMGKELMRIPMFAASIQNCHKILEPKGVDVIKIITSPDKTIFDTVLNCFIGIAAVQIGLTNVLKKLGLVANNIIGHSVGELGCAHYDGCFTDEEMILAAYARGLVSIQTKLIKGSMAAVGLGYEDMLPLCPPSIDIACRNSSDVCTISGPADAMKKFVAELTAKGIFAREVACGNIAYHSRYIQDAGPGLLEKLKQIIKNPIKRSKKWISTSWPADKRDDEIAEMCSAEYHTNNLLSPVYFEEAAKLIPENAVVVEVAPHGLMQAILKRSHPKCTHIPLTRREHKNPLQFLFEAMGRIYQMGYNLKINELYPSIQYPVSIETSPLSHLLEWYHEDDWLLCTSMHNEQSIRKTACARNLAISVADDDDFTFLAGHIREGKYVLPEAAILFYVWETLAMFKEVNYADISVAFNDVNFHTEVVFKLQDTVNLHISINNKGNNYFEVTRNDVVIASGYVYSFARNLKSYSDYVTKKTSQIENEIEENEDSYLNSDDVYKIFKWKGYCYQNDFQMICSASFQKKSAKINLTSNWILFIDSLIQLNILARAHDGVSVPKFINSLRIDMTDHFYKTTGENSKDFIQAHFDKYCEKTTCGGVKIDQIVFKDKPVEEPMPDVLETVTQAKHSFESQEFKLVNAKPGDIDDIRWEEAKFEVNSQKLVKVYFAAPSIRDVQNAVGIIDTKKCFGMDFSGMDTKNNKVMGLVAGGALASVVEPDEDLLWPVPNHWTLEEAATVPLPYVHAYYCLIFRGGLRARQSVFISGGAGALGQALISICLSLRCNVYTSVCNMHKKRFLMRLFPNLEGSHIGFSRDVDFYNMVLYNSKGKRCDLVINSSVGVERQLLMKCVGPEGYFIDVSDYDMRNNRQFGMFYLMQGKNYSAVDLSQLFKPANIEDRRLLQKLISDGIATGIVKPLTYVMYAAEDIKKAFRLISQSNNRGRALIQIRNTDVSIIDVGAIPRKWNKMGATIKISTEHLNEKLNCVNIMNTEEKLQGIFIIKPELKDHNDVFSLVVANLDDISRNNHPELEHFVIIARNAKKETGLLTADFEDIFNKRSDIGLPALIMRVELEDYEVVDETHSEIKSITISTVFKVLEVSLRQNYTKVYAHNKVKNNNDFYGKMRRILGVQLEDALYNEVLVKDLVCNYVNVEEIKNAIMENYEIHYTMENIMEMTIHTLKNLCSTKMNENTKFDAGLGAFYSNINSDAIEATEIFVPIPTLSSAVEEEKNLHAKATNIILIPGFEGNHHIFKSMCDRLKVRATALQLGPDASHDSIQQIALNLKNRLKKRYPLEPKFYLLGYSFGVNVALEIAALLEKDGLVGVVFCLDSSPDALRKQLDAYLGKLTENQLQNAVIKHMLQLMSGSPRSSLDELIEKTDDWDEKVSLCIHKLKECVNFSHDFMRDIVNTFYVKIGLARIYKPEFKLKSDIVLLKGIPHPNVEKLDFDYGLSKYAENPVKVFSIDSDIALAPFDWRLANIVNKMLDPVLLDEFKSKNLCETYTFNYEF
ncbi:hypothetical protein O0L34_g13591 [Tuta absoluta]|nr:hypothetical protein O0L34_g13591 [Tuta absoluta]